MELGIQANLARGRKQSARREGDVIARTVQGLGDPDPVGQPQPETDRMPSAGLDGHQRASGPKQTCGLGIDRLEGTLEGEVVEHEAVEHDVERGRGKRKLSRVPNLRLVGASLFGDPGDPIGIGIDGDEPEGGSGKQVASWKPSGADRQHLTLCQKQAAGEQNSLALHHVPVVGLERGLTAQAIEEVVLAVRLGGAHRLVVGVLRRAVLG